jgi:uncharacterized damage-inducible protein DinB
MIPRQGRRSPWLPALNLARAPTSARYSEAMQPRELLIDTFPHIPPARALEGLTPNDAERRVSGATHSVAELVSHVNFWMEWFITRCEGRPEAMVLRAADGWPPATGKDWPNLEERFRHGLERLVQIGDRGLDRPIAPAIEFPPLAHYTVGDVLVHVAAHNAHHLGQVITLRQIMQRWPPPSGGWTW